MTPSSSRIVPRVVETCHKIKGRTASSGLFRQSPLQFLGETRVVSGMRNEHDRRAATVLRRILSLFVLGAASLAASWSALAAPPNEPTNFDRDVAPLLVRRCLDCHDSTFEKGGLDLSSQASALKGGDSGAVIVRGKPEESLLWKRIDADEMPPGKPLPASEKALLKRWIAEEARWGTDPIDPYASTTEKRGGYDWWSLQPLKDVSPPATGESWSRNPIDRFLFARLQAKGLSPSAQADRRTLIRRLSFDILGVPPSPEEIADFEADSSPDAYERLVDRLLASPRYGERWARHWLDIIRFGESQGFERDKLRPNSWRYRDWVVDAFNQGMPFHRFARDQIAGDLQANAGTSGVIATGFLVAGPYDEVGHSQQSLAMRKVVRQDELEDLLASIGQTFLGLTVNCARCHDHKFDPIRQLDYYRMAAAVEGIRHGERPILSDSVTKENADQVARLDVKRSELLSRIAGMEETIRKELLSERKASPPPAVAPPRPIGAWEFDSDLKDSVGGLNGEARDGAKVENGRLTLDGKGYLVTKPLTRDLREKTLEAWVKLADLEQQGGAVVSVQTLDGNQFDAIVFGEREPRRWMAGSNFFLRSESFQGEVDADAKKELTHVAIVYSADGVIAAYRNGRPYGKPFKSRGIVKFLAEESQIVIGLRHTPPGGNKHLRGQVDRVKVYDFALTPEQVAASAGVAADFVTPEAIEARLTVDQRRQREQWKFEAAQLERTRGRAAATSVYAVAPGKLEPTHLLHRGNPAQLRQEVTAGAIPAAFKNGADFELSNTAPDAERRRKLAEWIAESDQPLFSRVIVNRLWHYHFGVGIVETCNDFGFNGARPSHPELLDWLARELQKHDDQLKPIHRLIVTSAAYRQSSRQREEALTVDAGNRWIWRRSPQRLEAEAVRDAMLSATGRLSNEIGGPGFEDFATFNSNSQFYTMLDPIGESFNRRSLYRTWVRSGRSPFLDVFDCPDPSTFTPQRAVTTTPLQALSLLNSSFSLRMADQLSDRIRREAGPRLTDQLRLGNVLVFGRFPTPEELRLLEGVAARHGVSAVCRAWFNSNEFLTID